MLLGKMYYIMKWMKYITKCIVTNMYMDIHNMNVFSRFVCPSFITIKIYDLKQKEIFGDGNIIVIFLLHIESCQLQLCGTKL